MDSASILPPITYATYIAVEPARVYDALATGPGWDSWFTTRATIDARPGGAYGFVWENFGADRTTLTLRGPVLSAIPEREFAFKWGSGNGMTTVTFRLEPRGPGTIVHVTEEGYTYEEEDVLACLNCACGWGEALTLLKFYLEYGVRYGSVPA